MSLFVTFDKSLACHHSCILSRKCGNIILFFLAKLLFKIKLWLKLNWLNFVHVSIIILLITQILSSASFVNLFFVASAHGDLFLWWTWNTFLFFPPLHPLLLVHYHLTTGSPWLYYKPTETQDWQFSSAACKVMNGRIIRPVPIFSSSDVRVLSSCPVFTGLKLLLLYPWLPWVCWYLVFMKIMKDF